MADETAFALKDGVKDLSSAHVSSGGETVDVKARLDNNNGVIVTDDPSLIGALDTLEVLKRVPVPSKSTAKSGGKE